MRKEQSFLRRIFSRLALIARRLVFPKWSELESSLDEIRRDLETKAERLSLEREELATLMSAISDAILAVDLEGTPLFFNSQLALLFGAFIKDTRLWEVIRAPEILNAFDVALKQGKEGFARAIPINPISGPRRFFSLSVSALRKRDGSVYGAVGIFHDVTELKAAEQMRIDFVANVSHELRTPLTAIKGYVDTLIQDSEQGQPMTPEFLQIIARNSTRLMGLIQDLLELSTLESGDSIQKERLSTKEITDRVIHQLSHAFEAKRQEVSCLVGAPLVVADSRRLEQVLVNLLDNASKYTPTGGKIAVSWDHDGNDVVLRVKDTGPGISVEHHARLFERFYRVDKARSREQGGTGLGLAIVKHIVQRHQGAVSIESQPPRGSTFICRFPG